MPLFHYLPGESDREGAVCFVRVEATAGSQYTLEVDPAILLRAGGGQIVPLAPDHRLIRAPDEGNRCPEGILVCDDEACSSSHCQLDGNYEDFTPGSRSSCAVDAARSAQLGPEEHVSVIERLLDAGGRCCTWVTRSTRTGRSIGQASCMAFDIPGEALPPDSDGDGRFDPCDTCPSSSDAAQDDQDEDGIGDACDPDLDADGIANLVDQCPTFTSPNNTDADLDQVGDACDNCSIRPNPDQRDSNRDGLGNLCDGDLDGNGVVNFSDLARLKAAFFTSDPDADLNGDGAVDFSDLGLLRQALFKAPGPGAKA